MQKILDRMIKNTTSTKTQIKALQTQFVFVSVGQLSVIEIQAYNNYMKESIAQSLMAQQRLSSKILNRKRIEARLQGLTVQEYEKIYVKLEKQNNRLSDQVKVLSEKVSELIKNRKMSLVKNPQIEQQIAKHKKELDIKYESMNCLKEEIQRKIQSCMTEQMRDKHTQNKSTIQVFTREIALQQQELKKLQFSIKQHLLAEDQRKPSAEILQKIEAMDVQNGALKERIQTLNQSLRENEKNSQEAIKRLYDLKKESQIEEKKKGKSNSSLSGLKISSTQLSQLEKEIFSLKGQKRMLEKQQITERLTREAKRTQLEKQTKEAIQYHKNLLMHKVKAINQLNLIEIWEKQTRNPPKKPPQQIIWEDTSMQTDHIIQKEFRKQWIGKFQGISFNDANHLEYRSECYIKSAIIYKNAQHIVFIRFKYQTPKQQSYETALPFDASVLKKCEAKKAGYKSNSVLCGIAVSLTDFKVTKVTLRWKDGECSSQGWDSGASTKYSFDIAPNERPICMYGTVSHKAKDTYALESLGCQLIEHS